MTPGLLARAQGAAPAALRPWLGARTAWLIDLVGYGFASGVALALDWGLLVFLVHAGMHYLAAAGLSFSAGMLLAYGLSVRFVFRRRRTLKPGQEAAAFFAIGVAGLVLNQALLALFIGGFGMPVVIAKAPTCVLVFTFNFMARRGLLFSRPRPLADP